ncbi:MAG TPA: glutamine amidotransferase [Candidatus Dormibacteraeota bacterium]|nr:glutamine amidotransferase [Candidatus Dormibacteraeota bacterium]
MKKGLLSILYLYPDEMNFYGDYGNVLALQRRLQWRGYEANVLYHKIGDSLPKNVDIIVGGGGQDTGQLTIHGDLLRIGGELHKRADLSVPMLMVCGLYQLFGKRFVTADNQELAGIGIFDAETIGIGKRMIGNIITETEFGELVGFENHSGQTVLGPSQASFGKVKLGHGNDPSGRREGAVSGHVYGTYLHGALLPKNPVLADALITQALINRGEDPGKLAPLDDSLALKVHNDARKRKQA